MITKILFRKKDHELFLMFWKRFEKRISRLKNVVIENTDDEIILTFEDLQVSNKITTKLIKFWLADAIVVYYKEKYFKSNLITPSINDLPLSLMIRALSVFDKATDVEYVLDKLEGIRNINVYSFFVFRLSELRFRWQDICELFLKNIHNIVDSDVFIELMRYLLLVTEADIKEVNLYLNGKMLFIKDRGNKDLTDPILLENDTGCIRAVFELITLAPRNIKVKFNKQSQPILVGFIDNLFASKVSYCT